MRSNKVKEKLQAGQVALALSGHSISSDTIDFCGQLGFDSFWIEGEHGPVTWDQIGDMTRACDLWGMASIMRVHSHEPGVITRALDRGVNGIVVPHVNTRTQAEQIVKAARFAPLGQRGMYTSGRRGYGDPDYLQKANDDVLLVVLLEEIEAIHNLADILAVDHIDVFFVAPSDLAQTMGYVGQPNHPAVQEVVQQALTQIVAAGRVAGSLGTEPLVGQYINLGARFFLVNYDGWIKAGASQYLSKLAGLTTA
jgi:4-hydroxy-2-oxoheptanedioate aldolase